MGAFHDFAAGVARAYAEEQRSIPRADTERATERWDGEGGNTQTRVAQPGRRA
jgi:hypothetical protein